MARAIGEPLCKGTLTTEIKELGQIADLVSPGLMQGSLLRMENFLEVLGQHLPVRSFRELKIPLSVVAADYWSRRQVVLQKGELLPAIGASAALPGLFKPAKLDGRMLIDGGMVNPVPFDLLAGKCDIIIAVDVSGIRSPLDRPNGPPFLETVFTAFQIMQQAILKEKLQQHKPDLLLHPPLKDIRVLDFHKIDEIYRQSRKVKAKLEWELERLLA